LITRERKRSEPLWSLKTHKYKCECDAIILFEDFEGPSFVRAEELDFIVDYDIQYRMGLSRSNADDDLFGMAEQKRRIQAMKESIHEVSAALEKLGRPSPWSAAIKATDDFLDPLFKDYSQRLGVSLTLRKNEYYKLANFLDPRNIESEVRSKLDAIFSVAQKAAPLHK